MHLEALKRRRRDAVTSRLSRWLAALFPFSIVGSVLGQSMLTPPPGFQGAPSVPQMGVPSGSGPVLNNQVNDAINASSTQSTGEGTPALTTGEEGTPAEGAGKEKGGVGVLNPAQDLMQWGALHLHAAASYQFLYDSEIHTQPGASTSTMTHSFTVPITALIGPHVTLNYTPSYRIFSERDFHNTLDHFASLSAGVGYGACSFGLSQSFSRTDEPLIETSGQTSQDNYNTGLSMGVRLNDRVSLSTSVGMDFNYVNGGQTNIFTGGGTNTPAILTDTRSFSGSEWLNYQVDEKLGTGIGVTFGYSDQKGGFRSIDQQYEGKVSWHPGDKLSLQMTGGMEVQQFLNADGAPDNVTPILSATLSYQALEHTSFALFADRTVSPSLFELQITEVTSVGVGFQQRLLGALQFSAGFNYSVNDFKTTTGQSIIARTDDIFTYTAGLSLPVLKHGSLAVFYAYNKDLSSQAGFSYASSEIGATVTWAY